MPFLGPQRRNWDWALRTVSLFVFDLKSLSNGKLVRSQTHRTTMMRGLNATQKACSLRVASHGPPVPLVTMKTCNSLTQGSHGSRAISEMRSATFSGKILARNFRRRSRLSGCHGGLRPSTKLSRHTSQRGPGIGSGMYILSSHFQHQ